LSLNVRELFGDSSSQIVAVKLEERSIEQAQRDVYESHRHRIFSLAYHMTGNELHAEQVLTDSFIQAFAADPRPDGEAVDRALITQLRAHFPLTPSEPAPVIASAPMNGKNIRRTDLEEAIQDLPPTERLLFLLRDVEGYSSEAISRLVDIPQPQVNRALFSARIRLRSILADMETRRPAA
jgi:RNA polymerase sigma-70 factor (ECF subfamily)